MRNRLRGGATSDPAHEALEGEEIAVTPEATDLADARRCDLRLVAVGLASLGIREMHLDAGEADGLDRVEQRERRVRQRASVEEEAVELPAGLADDVEERALVVRLEA